MFFALTEDLIDTHDAILFIDLILNKYRIRNKIMIHICLLVIKSIYALTFLTTGARCQKI